MFAQLQLVPKDIPLPLPLPEEVLIVLLVASFLLHILFVNLMVGGSILTLWYEIRGLKDKKYDALAYQIAQTITVNKSLAVVLGVAPLLSINVLYTIYFYSANALTGKYWIMLVPLVAFVFLLLYAHKYSWKTLEHNKPLHISILAVAVACFLFIPFVFLANINLMLFLKNGVRFMVFYLRWLCPMYCRAISISWWLRWLLLVCSCFILSVEKVTNSKKTWVRLLDMICKRNFILWPLVLPLHSFYLVHWCF